MDNKMITALGLDKRIEERYKNAENAPLEKPLPAANRIAQLMHPKSQAMVITDVRVENGGMHTYRFEAADGHELAYFSAGQYIPVYVEIEGNLIERPYALASSPEDSINGYYEISVKPAVGGYVSNYIVNNWEKGMKVTLGAPEGNDTYSSLRDRKEILGLAGGIGVTPFRSMVRAICDGTLDASLTLLYGCNTIGELAFKDEWKEYEEKSNGRFRCVYVIAKEEIEGCEHGFITEEIMRKYVDLDKVSIFVNGPQGLITFAHSVLDPLGIRRKYVHYGIGGDSGFRPSEDSTDKTFTFTIHKAGETFVIPAKGSETVMQSIERAGLKPAARCRSGICGFCRSYLISGEVYSAAEEDGVRERDRELGFIHPCECFPKSDLEIVVHRA